MILEYPSFIYDHYKIYPRLGDLDFESMTCIDFGCGDYRSDVAKQVLDIPFKELTSIEGYKKDYDTMLGKEFKAKKHIPINAFIPDILPTLKEKYDLVLAFDVIEHLEKEEGLKLLEWIKKHCTKALLFVPEEPEGFHRKWEDGNALQAHISHWNEEDFTSKGFKVERIKDGHGDIWDGKPFNFDALWVFL
jgi:hypothetical protein